MYKDYLLDFHSMTKLNQLSTLGKMIFRLSICGRDTYCTESDGIENQSRLRRINELIHRIASLHTQIASENAESIDSFIDGIFNTIDHEIFLLKIKWSYLFG